MTSAIASIPIPSKPKLFDGVILVFFLLLAWLIFLIACDSSRFFVCMPFTLSLLDELMSCCPTKLSIITIFLMDYFAIRSHDDSQTIDAKIFMPCHLEYYNISAFFLTKEIAYYEWTKINFTQFIWYRMKYRTLYQKFDRLYLFQYLYMCYTRSFSEWFFFCSFVRCHFLFVLVGLAKCANMAMCHQSSA